MQILDKPDLGSLIGAGLGRGLSNVVSERLSQRKTRKGLQAMGMERDVAKQIASLPPQMQQEVLKNYLAASERTGLSQALGAQFGQGPGTLSGDVDNLEALGASPDIDQNMVAQNLAQPNQMAQGPMQPGQPQSLASLLQAPRLGQKMQMDVARMQQQERHFQQQQLIKMQSDEKKLSWDEQKESNKETLPVYTEINKKASTSRDNILRLDRMESLVKEGKLTSPGMTKLIKSVGCDFLLSPESQEFEKLSNEFFKGAKDIFGARLTNADLAIFKKMIPNLAQSKEGKLRVLRNLRLTEKATLLKKEAMDEIIAANNGRRPRNLSSLIEARIGSKLDAIAAEYKKGFQREEKKEEKSSLGGLFGGDVFGVEKSHPEFKTNYGKTLDTLAGLTPGAVSGAMGGIGSLFRRILGNLGK